MNDGDFEKKFMKILDKYTPEELAEKCINAAPSGVGQVFKEESEVEDKIECILYEAVRKIEFTLDEDLCIEFKKGDGNSKWRLYQLDSLASTSQVEKICDLLTKLNEIEVILND